MALIFCGILVLMLILKNDFSGHYNRLALISLDFISGVYCKYSIEILLRTRKLKSKS